MSVANNWGFLKSTALLNYAVIVQDIPIALKKGKSGLNLSHRL